MIKYNIKVVKLAQRIVKYRNLEKYSHSHYYETFFILI